jgi:hypothetical protein
MTLVKRICRHKATKEILDSQSGEGELQLLVENVVRCSDYAEDELEALRCTKEEYEKACVDSRPLDDVKNKKIEEAMNLAMKVLDSEFDSIEIMVRLEKGIPDPADLSFVELMERYIDIRNQYQAHRAEIEALPKEGIDNYVISYI